MMIVPMLLAALLVVGAALLGIIVSGRDVDQSRVPRPLTARADAIIGVPQLADPRSLPRRLASGSMTLLPQAPAATAGGRLRLPGLRATRAVPVLRPAMRRAPTPRRLPTNAFSDES
jgi:hypothetical protein